MHRDPVHPETRTVLVLGAYGLIGQGVVCRLLSEGFAVSGLGRDEATARRICSAISWTITDMRQMTQPEDWRQLLSNVTAVVNCSGALQDGGADDLEAVHHHAVRALAEACTEAKVQCIQISAVGARDSANTQFLASKARGDAAIRSSGASYQIFRPGLVLAAQAYGGTALLRMLAAFPYVQPLAKSQAQIQTVGLSDVAEAVVIALRGGVPDRFECDLVERESHSLHEVVAQVRRWLGFDAARWALHFPNSVTGLVGFLADKLAGWGWRSPLRSTALRVLDDGVQGNPEAWARVHGADVPSLQATLNSLPVGAVDRLAARMALMKPVLIGVLCSIRVDWLVQYGTSGTGLERCRVVTRSVKAERGVLGSD